MSLAPYIQSALGDYTARFSGCHSKVRLWLHNPRRLLTATFYIASGADAHDFEEISAAVKKCVAATLAQELRARNRERRDVPVRLLDELWCMIWEHLPMQDCVIVSHICHYWRELALGTPRLWCELDFFTSRHGGPCECLMCSALELDDIHRLGNTNIHLITNIMGRSLALPLRLNITAPVPRCEPDDTAYLTRMLKPCIDRLVALNVKTDDPWLAGEVIQGFPSLPALRSLSYRHINEFNYEGLFLGPVVLPALQVLDLTTRNVLHSDFPQSEVTLFSLPSVHTLRTVVQRLEDLYMIFSACPKLQDLSVTIEYRLFASPEPASSWRGIRQRAASVPAVEICYSVPEQVAAVLAIFHDPSRSKLVITFQRWFGESPPPPFAILADVKRPTQFCCCLLAGRYPGDVGTSLSVREGDGTTTECYREIRKHKTTYFSQAWRYIHVGTLETLVVDLDMWVSLAPVPALPTVRRIDFMARSQPDEIIRPLINIAEEPPSLPMLDEVRFISADGRDVSIDAEALELFLRVLRSEVTPVPFVTFHLTSVIGNLRSGIVPPQP